MSRPLLAACLLVLGTPAFAAEPPKPAKAADPAKAAAKSGLIVDLGGVFLYSEDAPKLAAWYKEKLGVAMEHNKEEDIYVRLFPHGDGPGAFSVFAIYPKSHVGKSILMSGALPKDRNLAVFNFRVDDFDAFLARLASAGIPLEGKTQDFSYGRFGWFRDGEGNPIEFWQPK